MHHLGITPSMSDVWIGFENGVDSKNWNNSDLLPLVDFSTEGSYWELRSFPVSCDLFVISNRNLIEIE